MDYKVSVIVPVYNSQSLLPSSLGNLLNQTLQDIQVILVNDASTDNSLKILSDAKAAFPDKVTLIDLPKNGGPGVARNAALDVASGEYIGFMDSDDLIDPSMYEKLYTLAKENDADIADCAYLRDSTGDALIHFSQDTWGELSDKNREILIACGGYNCMKIFRRSLFEENSIRFRPVYVLEDTDFLVKSILCAKKVIGIPEVLYRYRDGGDSLSSDKPMAEYVNVQLEAMDAVYRAASPYQNYNAIQDGIEYMLLSMYKNIAVKIFSEKQASNNNVNELLKKAKELRFKTIKKEPKNNRFVRDKFNDSDIAAIRMADEAK